MGSLLLEKHSGEVDLWVKQDKHGPWTPFVWFGVDLKEYISRSGAARSEKSSVFAVTSDETPGKISSFQGVPAENGPSKEIGFENSRNLQHK